MTLDSLVKMAKSDRYTQDGRDVVNDVRKTYQIGQISEATGLQKTANGWVKPKQGNGGAKAAERPESKAPAAGKGWESTQMASGKMWDSPSGKTRIKEHVDPETKKTTYSVGSKSSGDNTPEKSFGSLEEAFSEGESRENKNSSAGKGWESTEMASGKMWDSPSGKTRIKEHFDPATKKTTYTVGPKSSGDRTPSKSFNSLEEAFTAGESLEGKEPAEGKKPAKSTAERMKAYVDAMNKYNGKFAGTSRKLKASSEAFNREMLNELNGEYKRSSEDAAPRELTGDTRIRIRK